MLGPADRRSLSFLGENLCWRQNPPSHLIMLTLLDVNNLLIVGTELVGMRKLLYIRTAFKL